MTVVVVGTSPTAVRTGNRTGRITRIIEEDTGSMLELTRDCVTLD